MSLEPVLPNPCVECNRKRDRNRKRPRVLELVRSAGVLFLEAWFLATIAFLFLVWFAR